MASLQTEIREMQKQVQQLRVERNIKRRKVSECCADLLYYCKRHTKEDHLLTGKCSHDPFDEGKACAVM